MGEFLSHFIKLKGLYIPVCKPLLYNFSIMNILSNLPPTLTQLDLTFAPLHINHLLRNLLCTKCPLLESLAIAVDEIVEIEALNALVEKLRRSV